MGTTQENFEYALKFGEEGEHEVAQELIDRGVSVLPLYQFDAKEAPILFSGSGNFVMPDLTCFNPQKGECYFVEVKTKKRWVNWRGKTETGLNQRLYDQYWIVKKQTGLNVYVIFNHKEHQPCGYFFCEIDTIISRMWNGKAPDGKYIMPPMVFWDIKDLKQCFAGRY